jgi:HD domain-containing protein
VLHRGDGEAGRADGIERGAVAVAAHDQPVQPVRSVLQAGRGRVAGPQVLAPRRAGFVHGFGRLGVSNSIWDRPGPLSAGEWERIRMYPYLTERMLHQSAALAPLGEIAVQHRERLDGSGYPRGLSGSAISRRARRPDRPRGRGPRPARPMACPTSK